ncbi:MAG: sensor histidine kinase, partial [Syntrophomonas sp.]
MDTKSKNIDYSGVVKLAAVLIVWLGFLGTMGSCIYLHQNYSIASSSSYTEEYSFQSKFAELVHDVVEYHVLLPSDEHINTNSGEVAQAAAEDEQAAAADPQPPRRIERKLPAMVNFVYYVRNTESGETWSNLKPETGDPVKFILKQKTRASLNGWTSDASVPLFGTLKEAMAGSPYEVYAAVATPLQPGDMFYDSYWDYTRAKARTDAAAVWLVISFILMTAAFAYLLYITVRREPEGESAPPRPAGMYADVHTVLVLIAAFLSLNIAVGTSPGMSDAFTLTALAVILSVDLFIGLTYVLSMARQIRDRSLFTNTLLYKLGCSLKAFFRLAFQGRGFKLWILPLLLGYGLSNGLLFMAYSVGYPGYFDDFAFVMVVLILTLNAGMVYFAARSLTALPQIMEASQQISAGNLDYPLDSAHMPVSFAAFAEDICSLQGGLKEAVAEAVKGERMKTDLITNVSHDLKTPL